MKFAVVKQCSIFKVMLYIYVFSFINYYSVNIVWESVFLSSTVIFDVYYIQKDSVEGYIGRTMKLRQVVVETKFLTVVVDRATKLVTAAVVWMHDGRRPNKRRLQQLGSQASPPLRRSQKLHCDGIVTLSMASFFYLCIKLDLAFTNRVEEQKQQRQLLLLASFPPLVKFRIHAMFDQRTRTEGS